MFENFSIPKKQLRNKSATKKQKKSILQYGFALKSLLGQVLRMS
jgi:hypothetical protein